VTSTLSSKTYLKNEIEHFKRLLVNLQTFTCPMDPDYHTDMDSSPSFGYTDKSMYRSLIGRVQWSITRVWIDYGSSMLSRYNMVPMEGHLIAMKKLFGYLKGHMQGRIVFDTRKTDVTHTQHLSIPPFGNKSTVMWRRTCLLQICQ